MSSWWQLKYGYFHPENWWKWSNLTFVFFRWGGSPPTSKWFISDNGAKMRDFQPLGPKDAFFQLEVLASRGRSIANEPGLLKWPYLSHPKYPIEFDP